ncbi:MAG: DUF3499 family protein [bacterium]|nr:DUF3499 family protein [bacterium]
MQQIFCARTLCSATASAVLFINARELTVQLVDLDVTSDVGGVPLCKAHADAVVVPQGWELRDLRTPAFEPEFDAEPTAELHPLEFPNHEIAAPTKPAIQPEDTSETKDATPMLSRAFRAAGLD